MTSQGQEQRFTDDFRCPICDGSPTDPRGQGQRCYGYRTEDWVYCTREDRANGAQFEPSKGAYIHKARGACKCGVEHAPDPEPARKPKRGRLVLVAEYPYLDAANQENFKVLRFVDESTGEKTFRQNHWDKQSGRYERGRGPAPLILYKLDMLAKAPAEAVVWIVEGENDVNRLNKLGLLATCNPMGAGKWKDFFAGSLAGRTCVILPDNDQVGKDHAKDVARSLQKTAQSVKIVDLPNLPEKGDVSDWLDAGEANTVDRLRDLAAVAPELKDVDLGPEPKKEKEKPKSKNGDKIVPSMVASQADLLLEIAERATLWRTETDEGFASIPTKNGAVEHVSINSLAFTDWLMRSYWSDHKGVLQQEAINGVRSLLSARARFDGESEKSWLRVAEGADDANGPVWWIDLADEERRAVRITAKGWEVVQNPPVKFIRPNGMRPLPVPERGGSLDDLWEFVNVDAADRPLLVASLLSMYRPKGPYPIVVLSGEQGCAKSTTTRVLKRLVDPRTPTLGSLPDSLRDLFVVAGSNWLLTFDNMSSISRGMSNALCQLALEGGIELRSLHTDKEVTILEAMRPMILNGIDDFARAPDLVDRVVLLTCPVIPAANRRREEEVWARFDKLRPRLLGAICDAISAGLATLPTVHLKSLPRMADFAIWGEAVWRGLGHPEGAFLATYLANRDSSSISTLEDSPVADALFELGRKRGGADWEGTIKELLDDLRANLSDGSSPGPSWPRAPKSLSSHLRRIAQPLRTAGVNVAFTGKTKRGRTLVVTWSDGERISRPLMPRNYSSLSSPGEGPPPPGWTQNQNGEWVPY